MEKTNENLISAEKIAKELEALASTIRGSCGLVRFEISNVYTAAEADEKWGLTRGTVRQNCVRGALVPYIELGLVRKSGSNWLVTDQAMREVFGDPERETK